MQVKILEFVTLALLANIKKGRPSDTLTHYGRNS